MTTRADASWRGLMRDVAGWHGLTWTIVVMRCARRRSMGFAAGITRVDVEVCGEDARLLGARTAMAKRRPGLRVELGARCGGSWWWSLPVRTAAH